MSRGMTLSIRALYNWDEGVFDLLELPGAMDRDAAIACILMRCQDLELLYPDWGYMRQAVGYWSHSCQWSWEKLAETLGFDYDPIANYDRREEWADVSDGAQKSSGTASAAAFNSMSLKEREASEATASTSTKSEHTGRVEGNIGVTSTQELIKQEREVSRYNIYDEIADDFKARFCLMVY